jgi:hypothetical protein
MGQELDAADHGSDIGTANGGKVQVFQQIGAVAKAVFVYDAVLHPT